MKILLWPSPTLKEVSEPVNIQTIKDGTFRYKDRTLQEITGDMEQLMWLNKGLGLSAIQVGIPLKIVTTLMREIRVMINPTIVEYIGNKQETKEGCLSLPGVSAIMDRYYSIQVHYWDASGDEQIKLVNDIAAQCVQHEVEHLDGHFFTENLSKGNQQAVFGEINKLRKVGLWKTKGLE
jgi:peptide deformylase